MKILLMIVGWLCYNLLTLSAGLYVYQEVGFYFTPKCLFTWAFCLGAWAFITGIVFFLIED